LKSFSKRYAAHISFVFEHEVSPEEVQASILRCVATKAFAIPGRVTIDLVTPQDMPAVAGPAIGKMEP
jgi:hypothetical protein